MGTPMRLLLSPKCLSPLSPIKAQVGRSLSLQKSPVAYRNRNIGKKLEYAASPSKPDFLKLQTWNHWEVGDHLNNSDIQITVPDLSKREVIRCPLLVDTPQKANILKNGLSENDGLNILGRGAFGTVIRGTYKNKDVAIKVIKLDAKQNRKLRESNVLSFDHKNVVKTLDIVMKENENFAMIIMEHLACSRQLQNILDDKKVRLGEDEIAKFALDICRGLSYCHRNGILHLDVKPGNVLVCDDFDCKLCDFGNCCKISEKKLEDYEYQGTIAYAAPEMLLGGMPTTKSDIYSFGILLWQMVHRKYPYQDIDRNEIVLYKVVKFGLRPNCEENESKFKDLRSICCESEESEDKFKAIYTKCWATLPAERPDTSSVINLLNMS